MSNNVKAIEVVVNSGASTIEEIKAVLLSESVITVPVLGEALKSLGEPVRKDNKESKAHRLAVAVVPRLQVNKQFDGKAAAGETPVAASKQKEEKALKQNEMKEKVESVRATRKVIAEGQAQAAANVKEELFMENLRNSRNSHDTNPDLVQMMEQINAAKEKYLEAIGENDVTVEEIMFYAEKAEASREEIREKLFIREIKLNNGSVMRFVGEVTVRMPEEYAQIKVWNPNKINSKGKKGAPDFIDFVGYDLDLTKRKYNMRKGLAEGTGLVVLSIYEFEDKDGVVSPLQVSLPTEKGKDGTRYPIFQTSDVRFAKSKDAEYKDQPLYLAANNEQFNAQVTAFVQFYAEEFIERNPMNNRSFDLAHCANMTRFGASDGVMADEEMDTKKNRTILNQPDIAQLDRVGSKQPTAYCHVFDKFLGMEGIETLNYVDRLEDPQGTDDKGNFRVAREGEVVDKGRIVKRADVINDAIARDCMDCPFHCNNSPKDEHKVGQEKAKAREEGKNDYVAAFYRERPKASAQAIQTLVVKEGRQQWITGYPYQMLNNVEDVLGVRVKSAGLTVSASDDVIEMMNPEYEVQAEEFDVRRAEINKIINQLFHAALNYRNLDEAQIKLVEELELPEDANDYEVRRWEKGIELYVRAIQWAKEAEERSKIARFKQKFFIGPVEGMREIHVEEFMADALYRAENGMFSFGLGYDDMTATEFVRYLDEAALDFVHSVIFDGAEYCIVGGRYKDKELGAGALQEKLQQELTENHTYTADGQYVNNSILSAIMRDEKPKAALNKFQVCDDVRAYLAEAAKLNK